MTSPIVLGGAIEAIKSALELANALKGTDAALAQADLKLRIIELIDALLNAKMGIAEAQAEMLTLRQRVADLENERKVKAAVSYRGGLYWTKLQDGREDGPFCTPCFDTKNKLVRVKDAGNDYFFCPVCQHGVDGPNGGPNRQRGGIRHPGIDMDL